MFCEIAFFLLKVCIRTVFHSEVTRPLHPMSGERSEEPCSGGGGGGGGRERGGELGRGGGGRKRQEDEIEEDEVDKNKENEGD